MDRAYVLGSESLTREAGYVAMSRARASTELFVPVRSDPDEVTHDPRARREVDPLDELRRRLGTSRAKGLAIDELETAPPRRRWTCTTAVAPRVQRPIVDQENTPPTPSIVALKEVEESAMRRPWVRKS